MDNEIILIDKPTGWTSFDVVAKIRGTIKHQYLGRGEKPTKRQLKVGHAGTLDPFATGLLVILRGEGTKRADQFLKLDKTYRATFQLGKTSTTGDPEGETTDISADKPSLEAVQAALEAHTGQIEQTPPAYSAIKINGQRAYKLARRGETVEMPSRQVTISRIDLISYDYPDLSVRASVSSGTYIRTLAEDIGAYLKTGAYCSELRRETIGQFSIDQAMTVADFVDSLQ